MTEANIRDLTPTTRNKILQAKVYRAWIHRDPPDTTDKGLRAILLASRLYWLLHTLHGQRKDWQPKSKLDYIGCYIHSTDKEKIGNPNRNQVFHRKVEIQNLNRNSIELTLWGSLAETFNKEGIDALEKPVIIVVTSCRVSRYQRNLQLSSTPATYYYINPTIPELEQYKQEYRAVFNLNPPLQVIRHPFQDKEKEKTRNRIPLAMLMGQNPLTYQGVRFTCDGTITGLNTDHEWYYKSCNECTNKAEFNEDIYECKVHETVAAPNETQTVMVTFFTPKANKIVGIECNTLVTSLKNPDPRHFPKAIKAIIGKRHIFQFHYNTPGRQGAPDFILNDILDIEDPPKQLEPKPSGSTSKDKQHAAVEYAPATMPLIKSEIPSPASKIPSGSPVVQAKKETEETATIQTPHTGDTTPQPILTSPKPALQKSGNETAQQKTS
ncbi:nucleic acid-binding, OB-fold protein [Artemisia annua]|uniref:Nucleic acid-binding, OB-fold protein n=1 Tax=Artemisia annua TaxID=35608 RepID=A0A2U1KSN1_ARTAN|nr:nucleic acid-binding, OB-fold protein [Artemisia annua]